MSLHKCFIKYFSTFSFPEKDFLVFFFKRLKENSDSKYADEFPFISPCGHEKNYVRCDDTPIVFTHVIETDDTIPDLFAYNGAGNLLTVDFEPKNVCMLPQTGRVYHPAPEKFGGIGLIRSSLAIEFSKHFEFAAGDESKPPTHFTWRGQRIELTNTLFELVKDRSFDDVGAIH